MGRNFMLCGFLYSCWKICIWYFLLYVVLGSMITLVKTFDLILVFSLSWFILFIPMYSLFLGVSFHVFFKPFDEVWILIFYLKVFWVSPSNLSYALFLQKCCLNVQKCCSVLHLCCFALHKHCLRIHMRDSGNISVVILGISVALPDRSFLLPDRSVVLLDRSDALFGISPVLWGKSTNLSMFCIFSVLVIFEVFFQIDFCTRGFIWGLLIFSRFGFYQFDVFHGCMYICFSTPSWIFRPWMIEVITMLFWTKKWVGLAEILSFVWWQHLMAWYAFVYC